MVDYDDKSIEYLFDAFKYAKNNYKISNEGAWVIILRFKQQDN